MALCKDEYYYETGGMINKVIVTGGNERVKTIEYFDNGILKYSFAVTSELFKNKNRAFKYFGHKLTCLI